MRKNNIYRVENFECHSCGKHFTNSYRLIQHICQNHPTKMTPKNDGKVIACNTCHRRYRYKRGLTAHIRQNHSWQMGPKIPISQKSIICMLCSKKYSYKRGLNEHIRKIHPEIVSPKERRFDCNICHRKYSYLKGLREHIRNQHPDETVINNPNKGREKHLIQESVKSEEFKCSLCMKIYVYRGGIVNHIKKQHPATIQQNDQEEKPFKCRTCCKCYQSSSSLSEHIRLKHREQILFCEICNKGYTHRIKLIQHMKWKHVTGKNSSANKRHIKQGIRICPLCMTLYFKKPDIVDHLIGTHNIEITQEIREYDDERSFKEWKTELEKNTRSRFVLYNKYKSDSEFVMTFICHRSGLYQSKSKGIRNMRRVGSKKINSYCPAEISLRICEENRKYIVTFISQHVGHNTSELRELRYLKLPTEQRDQIASFLSTDLYSSTPSLSCSNLDTEFLSYESNDMSSLFEMTDNIALLPLDEICDMTDFNEDALTAVTWIEENYNHTLYHKPVGNLDTTFPELESTDFVLIVMDEYQKQTFLKHASDIIAVNSTYDSKSLEFNLTILTVYDDLHREFPTIFMFSNRNDEYVHRVLFENIRQQLGPISPRVFISDLTDVYEKAWIKIMPTPERTIYCSWHVLREWRRNLHKRVPNSSRQHVKSTLESLRTELSPFCFHEKLQQFLNSENADFPEFKRYFEKCFQKNASKWAYCYRKYARVDTCTTVEDFITFCRKKRVNDEKSKVRLGSSLNAMSEMMQELYTERIKIEADAKMVPKVKWLRLKHTKAVKNADILKTVNLLDDGKWYVPSFEENGEGIHFVEKLTIVCTCELRCEACNACLHQFTCTCIDNCIEFNMCEHIHLVCLLDSKVEVKVIQDSFDLSKAENVQVNLFINGRRTSKPCE